MANPTPFVASLDALADDSPDPNNADYNDEKENATGVLPTCIKVFQNRLQYKTSVIFPVTEKSD